MRKLDGMVLSFNGELDALQVERLTVQDLRCGVHNGLPNATGELLYACVPLRVVKFFEWLEGGGIGVRGLD